MADLWQIARRTQRRSQSWSTPAASRRERGPSKSQERTTLALQVERDQVAVTSERGLENCLSKQQSGNRESAVFKAFLEAEPQFTGRSIAKSKHNENDTPDITAVDSGSKTIGVELVEWIPEEWISNFARWLRLLERMEVPKGWSVRLHIPDARSRCFEAGDRSNISAELSAVIRNHAPREPAPKVSATTIKSVPIDANVLSSQAPKLSAFCDLLMFCNFGFRHSIDFETAPLREDAEAALRATIEKKTTNPIYRRKKDELKLDHLVLLVHGSDALMMNEFLPQ